MQKLWMHLKFMYCEATVYMYSLHFSVKNLCLMLKLWINKFYVYTYLVAPLVQDAD